MGHYHQTISGIGKNKNDAEQRGIADFLSEYGNRHSVRDTSKHRLVKKVPPHKTVERIVRNTRYISSEPDPTAPQNEWLEEWEFELHTHA